MSGARNGASGLLHGGPPPLLPEGTYSLKFIDWETRKHLNRQPKVVLRFAICDQGEHFETRVERWYNARELIGAARRKGRFIVGWSSDLYREYSVIAGEPDRRDRIALSRLSGRLLRGEVQTVTSDRNQRALHPLQQYSVLRALRSADT